jgi:hypothetical protein
MRNRRETFETASMAGKRSDERRNRIEHTVRRHSVHLELISRRSRVASRGPTRCADEQTPLVPEVRLAADMNANLVARVSVQVEAAIDDVGKVLISPKAIKKYMFGATAVTDLRKGSSIVWRGEWKGKPCGQARGLPSGHGGTDRRRNTDSRVAGSGQQSDR